MAPGSSLLKAEGKRASLGSPSLQLPARVDREKGSPPDAPARKKMLRRRQRCGEEAGEGHSRAFPPEAAWEVASGAFSLPGQKPFCSSGCAQGLHELQPCWGCACDKEANTASRPSYKLGNKRWRDPSGRNQPLSVTAYIDLPPSPFRACQARRCRHAPEWPAVAGQQWPREDPAAPEGPGRSLLILRGAHKGAGACWPHERRVLSGDPCGKGWPRKSGTSRVCTEN